MRRWEIGYGTIINNTAGLYKLPKIPTKIQTVCWKAFLVGLFLMKIHGPVTDNLCENLSSLLSRLKTELFFITQKNRPCNGFSSCHVCFWDSFAVSKAAWWKNLTHAWLFGHMFMFFLQVISLSSRNKEEANDVEIDILC